MSGKSKRGFEYKAYYTRGRDAEMLRKQGLYSEAANLFRQNLAVSSKYFNHDHTNILNDRDGLSVCLHKLGQYQAAVTINEETLRLRNHLYKEAKETTAAQVNLAHNLTQLGRFERAILLLQTVLDIRTKTLGHTHPDTLDTRHWLASVLQSHGNALDAYRHNLFLLDILAESRRADDSELIECKHNTADNLCTLGGYERAMQLTLENLQVLLNTRGSSGTQIRMAEDLRKYIDQKIQSQREMQTEPGVTASARKEVRAVPPEPFHGPRTRDQGNEIKKAAPRNKRSNMYDARVGSGNLYTFTTRMKAQPGWFERLETTQRLVAQGRKSGGHKIKIAILDTGIDLDHPQFHTQSESDPSYGFYRDRIKHCKSFVLGESADQDILGHGTHSAAFLLVLAPKAHIYVGKVVEEKTGDLNPEVIAEAIRYATNHWKVDIITMSFGWPRHYSNVEQAIDHATSRHVIICAAASNSGANDNVAFPANYGPVICVHSATDKGRPSEFTPTPLESRPNFAVIGENVCVAWPGLKDGQSQSGTSVATPILAAVIALIIEFVDQKPRKTFHDRRVRTLGGITTLLRAMSKVERQYLLVQPWTMLTAEVSRTRVESRILDAMDRKFGLE